MLPYVQVDSLVCEAEFAVEKGRAIMNDFFSGHVQIDPGPKIVIRGLKDVMSRQLLPEQYETIKPSLEHAETLLADEFKQMLLRLDIVFDYIVKADNAIREVSEIVAAATIRQSE